MVDEDKIVRGDCRICDKVIGKNGVYMAMEAGCDLPPFAQIYLFLFGFEPTEGLQSMCASCSKDLVTTYRLRKLIEEREKVLKKFCVRNGSKNRDKNVKKVDEVRMSIKNIKQEVEEEDPIVETVVIKVEPNVQLEMEVSDDGRESDDVQISDDDTPLTQLKIRKIKKKTHKTHKSKSHSRPLKVEDEVIQCALCEYKSNVKDNYQKHVLRVHHRQEMKCDGCDEKFHLIYLLNEHRQHEHEFTHEYKVITVPSSKDPKDEEGELIRCPLCDYTSTVKGNYQKHVLRIHNRQEMQCDGCDEKFHLIYLLDEHRRGEHNFTHDYKVDESLKVKLPERRHGALKAHKFESNGNTNAVKKEEDDDFDKGTEFKCPLCSYSSSRHSRFSDHYRKMHDNIEMTCDGCSGKFHLFYRMLEHRKLDHKFDHEYVVQESVILEDRVKKEQRRLEKGQHFPCPECDRWFREKRNVAKHLKTVHKFMKYKIPKGEIRVKSEDGTISKKKYIYPTFKVVCNFCGKLFWHSSLENHIRNMHPEHRDPYICEYCDEKCKTKTTLLIHFYKIHRLEVRITKQQRKTADHPVRDPRRFQTTIKTPNGTVEYMCRYCPEKFPFKISRKRHEIHIHTQQYPFTCELCDKKFIVKFEFKRHLERHMEGKRLSCSRCQTCGQHFTKRKLLERHVCVSNNPNSYPEPLPEHLQHFAVYR